LYVNKKPIITNRNRAYFGGMGTRGVQEEVLIFQNLADQKNHVEAFTTSQYWQPYSGIEDCELKEHLFMNERIVKLPIEIFELLQGILFHCYH